MTTDHMLQALKDHRPNVIGLSNSRRNRVGLHMETRADHLMLAATLQYS